MALRDLPSVDALVRALPESLPRALVVEVARRAIEEARGSILGGREADPEEVARRELAGLSRLRPTRVINATGVLLHTNLGRAPLEAGATRAEARAASSYGNLELDLSSGERGGRGAYVHHLLRSLTGAGGALVVNNNAGMLYLTLAALAAGREVPVSRGELIEIGGSFRLPELMGASGARLVEVGTTNRTRPDDYRKAITAQTALLLKIHPSNYRITGFSQAVEPEELALLAGEAGVPLVVDVGSGLLDTRVPWLPGPPPSWLAGEPGVVQTLEAGADLVLFSGDKLLGGPQAGIAVGNPALIGHVAGHPVARAVRCGGSTLAALAATLELYARDEGGRIPFWAMASLGYQELEIRAKALLAEADLPGEIRAGASTPGAGSAPEAGIPSPVVMVDPEEPDRAWHDLLGADPPVVVRREADALVIDLRSVEPGDDPLLAGALRAACRS